MAAQIDEYFKKDLNIKILGINLNDIIYTEKLFTLVSNANALGSDMFASSKVFEYLVEQSIDKLKKPTRTAISHVADILASIISNNMPKNISVYRHLEHYISEHTNDLLTECALNAEEFWVTNIETENFVNTNDPLFR